MLGQKDRPGAYSIESLEGAIPRETIESRPGGPMQALANGYSLPIARRTRSRSK